MVLSFILIVLSFNAETMIILAFGSTSQMDLTALIPSRPPMVMSIVTKSGFNVLYLSTPSAPLSASATTECPPCSRYSLSTFLINFESSTIKPVAIFTTFQETIVSRTIKETPKNLFPSEHFSDMPIIKNRWYLFNNFIVLHQQFFHYINNKPMLFFYLPGLLPQLLHNG